MLKFLFSLLFAAALFGGVDRAEAAEPPPRVAVLLLVDSSATPLMFETALRSIAAQTVKPAEVVVVDNRTLCAQKKLRKTEQWKLSLVCRDQLRSTEVNPLHAAVLRTPSAEVYVMWDIADQFDSDRIKKQLEPLVKGKADLTVLPLDLLTTLKSDGEFELLETAHPSLQVAAYTTLVFTRDLYKTEVFDAKNDNEMQRALFSDLDVDTELNFVLDATELSGAVAQTLKPGEVRWMQGSARAAPHTIKLLQTAIASSGSGPDLVVALRDVPEFVNLAVFSKSMQQSEIVSRGQLLFPRQAPGAGYVYGEQGYYYVEYLGPPIPLLSNLPGTASAEGTNLGMGSLSTVRTKAVGLTVGAQQLEFASMIVSMSNSGADADLVGGIYSSNGGNPDTLLALFSAVTVGSGTVAQEFTLTVDGGSFALLASTSYWFVLDGPSVQNSLAWDTLSPNVAPSAFNDASFDGYRFSDDGGSFWTESSVFNGVTINAFA